jgi:hypothetical protein
MNNTKCTECGAINFGADYNCRRCSAVLPLPAPAVIDTAEVEAEPGRGPGQWLLWIAAVTASLLIASYGSLIVTSTGLSDDEQAMTDGAIAALERTGFSQEAFVLRHVVSFRGSDNWWNGYVGHRSAYAATNYPFAVVTLYSPFFKYATDDVERASILLHEAHHVFGENEDSALRLSWVERTQLGWTSERYGDTRVWKNTREWTMNSLPALFQCGVDGQSDCLQ